MHEEETKMEGLGEKEDKTGDEKTHLTHFEKFANLLIK